MRETLIIILIIFIHECTCFSSFWAPLFDQRILNYKVDVDVDPDKAKTLREEYIRKNGFRGKALIADLGNGHKANESNDNLAYGGVKFYYTYPGAKN